MNGILEARGSKFFIENKKERVEISGVEITIEDNSNVVKGQRIGFAVDQTMSFVYQKKIDNKWKTLNPSFYLPNIEYRQKSFSKSDFNYGESKIFQIYHYLKTLLPEVTTEGVAAMLGNFEIESNIESKRAEGDYLPPPIGATDTSWDNLDWLNISGPQIYNGSYPNILKRGLGLGQWTDTADGSVRHTMLLEFAKQKNLKWYDLNLQMHFILEGDHIFYRTIAKRILTNHGDVSQLTKDFLQLWEGNPGDKLLDRQAAALRIYQNLNQPQINTQAVSSWDFPQEYSSKLKFPFPSQTCISPGYDNSGSYYPQGQCTFYVYNRIRETHNISVPMFLGNGQDWVKNLVNFGWKYSSVPIVGAVASTAGGFDYTYPEYGHVMFVESVNPDGSFLISELNFSGVQDRVHWRICYPQPFYSFAYP